MPKFIISTNNVSCNSIYVVWNKYSSVDQLAVDFLFSLSSADSLLSGSLEAGKSISSQGTIFKPLKITIGLICIFVSRTARIIETVLHVQRTSVLQFFWPTVRNLLGSRKLPHGCLIDPKHLWLWHMLTYTNCVTWNTTGPHHSNPLQSPRHERKGQHVWGFQEKFPSQSYSAKYRWTAIVVPQLRCRNKLEGEQL